ncbi:hypothetical protein BJV74DRAFT_824791 [Russula compacta]|nr:hypothetical protein BJV74DRAFT_824791 [Russula compacta]
MVQCHYVVIAGTEPGIYRDWTDAAPKVTGIPGAIHKKFKIYPDALEAFNRARREGAVREIRVAPEPEDVAQSFNAPSPHSRSQESYEYAVIRVAPHAVARRVQPLRRNCAAASTTVDGLPPTYAGPSDPAERADSVTIGSELRSLQSPGQGSLRAPVYTYNAEQSGSPSPRRARMSSRGRHGSEGFQESQHGLVGAYSNWSRTDSRVAFSYGEVRPANTSTVCPKRVSRFPRIEDCQEIHRNGTCIHGHSLSVSALVDGCVDIGSEAHASASQGFVENLIISTRAHGEGDRKGKRRASVQSQDTYYLDPFNWSELRTSTPCPRTREENDASPSFLPLSRPPSECSHISSASSTETLASVISFDVSVSVETPETPGRSANVASSAPQHAVSSFAASSLVEDPIPGPSTQSLSEENGDDSPREPIDISPLSPRQTSPQWSPLSPLPHIDPEDFLSPEATGLGLSIEGLAIPPPSQLQPHRATTQEVPPGGLPYRHAGDDNESQSPFGLRGDDASPQEDAPGPLRRASSSHLGSMNDAAAPSRGVPGTLPLSPAAIAQPSHRLTPQMPFYPSLAPEDRALLSSSSLGATTLRLPTWEPTPTQVPGLLRSPLVDPRSPRSMLTRTRIPSRVMRLSRLDPFFGRPTPPSTVTMGE